MNLETEYEDLVVEMASIRKLQITEEGLIYTNFHFLSQVIY
jgi:hypothetical protein